jgi:hypothetical protein
LLREQQALVPEGVSPYNPALPKLRARSGFDRMGLGCAVSVASVGRASLLKFNGWALGPIFYFRVCARI